MPHDTQVPAPLRAPRDPRALTGDTTLCAVPVASTHAFGGLKRVGRIGMLSAAAAALTLGLFIGNTTIAGAVISTGILVVDSGAKFVQHPGGGVVDQVLVRNGDRVTAGQPLVLLDQTVSSARFSSATVQLLQNKARLARLVAERDELSAPDFSLISRDPALSASEFATILQTERDQFARRSEQLHGQLSQLDEQITQSEDQARANDAQLASALEQKRLVEIQLENLRQLYKQQLLPYPRLAESELSFAQIQGTEGSLRSAISADKAKLAELKVTKIQISRTWRAEVAQEIAQVQAANAQLTEQAALSGDQVNRAIIRAAQDGIIHELAPLAQGTVIQPGEKLMLVVPDHDRLIGEVKIRPDDIDQIYPGQSVTMQFSAFERATTPAVEGHLAAISADLIEDPRSGAFYYKARVVPEQLDQLSARGLKVVPGMPIEAFIKTEDRTILSYLTKPFFDQANRAFR